MKTQIYQLTCFINAWNKRVKKWESKYYFSQIYIGKDGLNSAYSEFETQKEKFRHERAVGNWNKYGEVRGKCELHIPHIHDNGTIAYWGDKILISENPDNI